MRLLLFDFDGVLVDSLDIYEKTVTECLEAINQPLTRGREEFLELFDGNFYECLVQKGVDLKKFMEAAVDILARVNYKDMKPIEAMLPVLNHLKERSLLVIISSNDTPTILEALSLYDFNGIFREVLGSDFMLSKRDKILYAAEKYNAALADICYIGDTTGDIREGKQAGVRTAGVAWGWHGQKRIIAAGPDYFAQTPADLLCLV